MMMMMMIIIIIIIIIIICVGLLCLLAGFVYETTHYLHC
jgi:hypothetical protein